MRRIVLVAPILRLPRDQRIVGGMNHPVISGVVQDRLSTTTSRSWFREGHALATKKNLSLTDLSGLEWVVPRSGTPGVATF
jgi:hypothetical protein